MMEIKLDIAPPPEGFEVDGIRRAKAGEYIYHDNEWVLCTQDTRASHLVAKPAVKWRAATREDIGRQARFRDFVDQNWEMGVLCWFVDDPACEYYMGHNRGVYEFGVCEVQDTPNDGS
jgi:uncharacterized protein YbcV (DUF1398 family)